MSAHDPSPTVERLCDVAVIGGSAAGLAAALQIVRQQRSVIVVDNGSPRNSVAAHMHSYLGYEGAPPQQLITAGRAEVRGYGGEILSGTALAVEADGDRLRVRLSSGHSLLARRALVATGLVDELPPIEGLAEHWGDAVISCPFCHGYEIRDRRVVQLVTHPAGLHTTALFRTLSRTLTVVLHDVVLDAVEVDRLRSSGIDVVEAHALRVSSDSRGHLCGIEIEGGRTIAADAVVITPRFHASVDALHGLDLKMADHPSGLGSTVAVDLTGATSVPGLYAAGNVADPTMQVLSAAANGSNVGAAISLGLATEDPERSDEPNDWDHRYSGDLIWSGQPNGTLVNEISGLKPGRVLDVGAGEGGDAIWLAQQGWRVTATDVSSRALDKVAELARQNGVQLECLHRDASALDAFPKAAFDLVSLQYGAIPRSPDQRGLHSIIGAVASGGTLLVVAHDPEPIREPIDTSEQTRMWDTDAFVGIDEFASALAESPGWIIERHETRPRPPEAASAPHVDDVVLRARFMDS